MNGKRIIFTDLDGTLLDHQSYSYAPASELLSELQSRGIPVIPASSKTRAEILALREELQNDHPFIVENGAAVFVPTGYFPSQPPGTTEDDFFWIKSFSEPVAHWRGLLHSLAPQYGNCYTSFQQADVDGVMALTGLNRQQASLAQQRDYTEPLSWHGSDEQRLALIEELRAHGAVPQQGGRFLSIGGPCDKGTALIWLQEQYQRFAEDAIVHSLAAGDAPNDSAMLAASNIALVVRSPSHNPPQIHRSGFTLTTDQYGPMGWVEGVKRWLELDLDSLPQND